MRIRKEDTAALIIDIQSRLFPLIWEHSEVEEKNLKLIEGLKALDIPIVLTEQYPKGIGKTIESIQTKLEDAYTPIEKIEFSCCANEHFISELAKLDKEIIIFTGIEIPVCVLQTVVDLLEKDYLPVVVEDCVSSRKENDKRIAIERMRQEGALITTFESILFELTEVSGTEQFKQISKIVK